MADTNDEKIQAVVKMLEQQQEETELSLWLIRAVIFLVAIISAFAIEAVVPGMSIPFGISIGLNIGFVVIFLYHLTYKYERKHN